MIKRVTAFTAVLISLLLVFGTGQAQQGASEIVLWSRYDLANTDDANAVTLKAKIDSFEANTGIDVVYEQVAWDQLATKLVIAEQAGGDVPDVVTIPGQNIPSLLDAGVLMPLDNLLAEENWLAELNAGDREACLMGGVRYCVAYNLRGGITYYRTDVFPDGFPTMAEGWLEAAPEAQNKGLYFSTQYVGRSYSAIETAWWPLIAANEGQIFDMEGKPAWASEAVAEVVAFYRVLYGNDYMPALNITGDFPDAETPWLAGEAASFRGASWSAMFVPGLRNAVDAGEVEMTGGIDFGSGPRVLLVSEVLIVPQGAVNPEGAREWIRAFFEPTFLAAWSEAQGGVPTHPAAAAQSNLDTPFFNQVNEILTTQGVYMPPSPYYLESLDVLAVAFQEMLLDLEIDALERLTEAQDEVLNRYW